MKNLLDTGRADEFKQRILRLTPESQPLWGKMNVAQALSHTAAALEMATGDNILPRMFIGRLLGGVVKGKVVGNDDPMGRGAPTAKALVRADARDFHVEQQRLNEVIDRFVAGGAAGCSTHPHTFFGPMTPDEWGILMYKHLDHHLRQFGV